MHGSPSSGASPFNMARTRIMPTVARNRRGSTMKKKREPQSKGKKGRKLLALWQIRGNETDQELEEMAEVLAALVSDALPKDRNGKPGNGKKRQPK